MAKAIKTTYALLMLLCMALFAACSDNDMDSPALDMDGDDLITSFSIDGTQGTIDNKAKTITVFLNPGTDVTRLQPQFTLSKGAASNIPSGSTVDFTSPVVFKITNGNTYIDYTVTVKVYEALITSFALVDADGNSHEGTIDNDAKAITVFMPGSVDVRHLTVQYTMSDSAAGSPAPGAVLDFTQKRTISITNHGAETIYTVSAVATDMPATAFIGTAATINGLKDEERKAAEWMLANVPRAQYISMQDLISGAKTLDPAVIKAVWWHGDDPNWPSQAWDSREVIKNYYAKGGSLFLSRYACRYVNDVYQIALDQKQPNAESKNDPAAVFDQPLGFYVDDASHKIFEGMGAVKNQPIMLIDKGLATTNCQVDWNIWDYPGHSLEGWQEATGGRRLAFEAGDSNKTAIVEFPARSKSAGRVILVGTGGFEWNIAGDANNQYAKNREKLATNILKYLCGE